MLTKQTDASVMAVSKQRVAEKPREELSFSGCSEMVPLGPTVEWSPVLVNVLWL